MEAHPNISRKDPLKLKESPALILEFLKTVKHSHYDLSFEVQDRRVLFGIQEKMHPCLFPLKLLKLIEEDLL